MRQGSERRQFVGIQALRGIAACMVVAYHATQAFGVGTIWESGAAGVDLFFVISGFVMAISCLGKRDLSASAFLKGRIIRIVPLYWILTALIALKVLLVHPTVEHSEITLPYLASSLLFIPFRNSLGVTQPIVSAGWTLCFEMFFYGMIATALIFRTNIVRFVASTIISLSIAGLFVAGSPTVAATWTNPILLEFLAGLLLGSAYLKGFRLGRVLPVVLGLTGIVAILHFAPGTLSRLRPIEWGIPSTLIVLAAVMMEDYVSKKTPAWMLKIGDASYSLYLTPFHPIVIVALSRVVSRTMLPFPEAITTALSLSASVFIALIVHHYVEIPVTNYLKRPRLAVAMLAPMPTP